MKAICILCENTFQPTKLQERKIVKHPHRIQICEGCAHRVKENVQKKRANT